LVAVRKTENLFDYDTAITVVAPEVDDKLEYHARQGKITLEKREYEPGEAARYGLVICATDDTALNRQVYEDTRGTGALVNVADDPPHCDFIFPAVLRRDCLTAAISTDGKAPFVAGHLRLILENIFPQHWTKLMRVAALFREKVRDRWRDQPQKRDACYSNFLEADWKTMLKEMDEEQLEQELTEMLERPE
jgi:siroheme synthase-like protein